MKATKAMTPVMTDPATAPTKGTKFSTVAIMPMSQGDGISHHHIATPMQTPRAMLMSVIAPR